MSPDTTIARFREELKALERYCTEQVSLVQRQIDAERKACVKRHDEIRALIARLVQDNVEQKRLDKEYRIASAALGAKHTKILHRILAHVGCGDGE
jgi:hypothetical protein